MERNSKSSDRNGDSNNTEGVLRRRAEDRIHEKALHAPEITNDMSPESMREVLHQLQVHQIELEMQNEELRQSQLELDAARTRYFDLYDLAPLGYFSVSEEGLILEANFAAATLLGMARRKLVAQPMSRFIVAADQDVYFRLRQRLTESSRVQTCELQIVKCDGTQAWVDVVAIADRDSGGALTLRLSLNDITDRKRVEEALRDSEFLYRSILNSVAAHIAVLDGDGVIIAVNQLWLQFALENASTPGEPVPGAGVGSDYRAACQSGSEFGGEEAAAALEGIHGVLDGRLSLFELEYPCHSPTQERWFSMSVTPLGEKNCGAVVAHTNITERKRAEENLLRQKERLRGIIDSAMDAIISVDDSQNIVLFNAAAEAIFGYSAEQMIGTPLSQLMPERLGAMHTEHLKNFDATYVTSRRMGSARRTVMGLRRNGEEFPIEASISQITDGRSRLYTVILRDVTDIRRAADDLHMSQALLREFSAAAQSIREEEKGRIARELHDELGQALTSLKMDVVWLKQKRTTDNSQDEKLEHMLSLLDDTVAATRRIASDLRPLILDDLGLKPAMEWLMAGFTARSGVACGLEITPSEFDLPESHATTVFRLLQELLTNITRHAQASRVEIALRVEDQHVWLSVRDNGRGFNVAESRKANSYGLMGMRERVYLLNGVIAIESSPSQGSRIDVRIPISQYLELT